MAQSSSRTTQIASPFHDHLFRAKHSVQPAVKLRATLPVRPQEGRRPRQMATMPGAPLCTASAPQRTPTTSWIRLNNTTTTATHARHTSALSHRRLALMGFTPTLGTSLPSSNGWHRLGETWPHRPINQFDRNLKANELYRPPFYQVIYRIRQGLRLRVILWIQTTPERVIHQVVPLDRLPGAIVMVAQPLLRGS